MRRRRSRRRDRERGEDIKGKKEDIKGARRKVGDEGGEEEGREK